MYSSPHPNCMHNVPPQPVVTVHSPITSLRHCANSAHCAIALHSHRPQTATARMKRINAVRPPSVTAQPLVSSRRRLSAL